MKGRGALIEIRNLLSYLFSPKGVINLLRNHVVSKSAQYLGPTCNRTTPVLVPSRVSFPAQLICRRVDCGTVGYLVCDRG